MIKIIKLVDLRSEARLLLISDGESPLVIQGTNEVPTSSSAKNQLNDSRL